MANQLTALKREFSKKARILEKANQQLKKEFVGIDPIIDELVENVRSWYTMNSIQEKPAVINLWGLTGVGKTSVIVRLMELIGLEDKTFRFDLGEKDGSRSFRNSLTDLCENKDDSPVAIILDELQHAATIKGPFREEISEDKNRMIWELIDSGKVSYVEWKSALWTFENLVKNLNELHYAGVRVKDGVVTRQKNLFRKEMDISEDDSPLYFVPEDEYECIIELADDSMDLKLKRDVKERLCQMNGNETIQFLHKVLSKATRPSIKSFHKAIIFVIGNVDEAYTMSGNYSADISADEFHEATTKITIPDIKTALRRRFRDEQIARLGNIHIIYPAFNKDSYYKIIRLELNRLSDRIKEVLNLKLTFDDTLIDEIYKEGVYPTQGARPLFTTIHQMVKSKLSLHVNIILKRKMEADQMRLSVHEGQLICDFYNDKELLFSYSDPITSYLEKLRKPKKDESQAIAAVHEAGHAVLSISLLKVIPELVVSVTSDSDANGFMYSKFNPNYTSRAHVLPKTAMLLGGIVAEEIIFGEQHLTTGGSSDLRKATESLMIMYKMNGFGSVPVYHGVHERENSFVYHSIEKIEQEVFEVIEKAKELAKQELTKNKRLLLAIAEYLSVESKLEKEQLIELIESNSDMGDQEGKPKDFYRETLKKQIRTKEILKETVEKNPIVLNKDKEGNHERR